MNKITEVIMMDPKTMGKVLLGVSGIAATVGFLLGSKIKELLVSRGYELFTEDGYIKYFNPETGEEVSVDEVVELIKRNNKYK